MPQHRPRAVRKAELARVRGCSRGAVTRACRGPLRAALLPTGMVDLDHQAVQEWLGGTDGAKTPKLRIVLEENAPTMHALAERFDLSVEEVADAFEGPLAAAVVPEAHVSAMEFAWLSGATVDEVIEAVRGELARAVTATGRIDISAAAALAFLARRPFPRRHDGSPIAPPGYLHEACVADGVELDHPITRAFIARCKGRVPRAADFEEGA